MVCVVSRRGGKFVKLCAFQAYTRLPSNMWLSAEPANAQFGSDVRHNGSMKIIRNVIVVLALSSIALATSACPEKGPLEKAGEKVDDAIDETKDAIDDKTK